MVDSKGDILTNGAVKKSRLLWDEGGDAAIAAGVELGQGVPSIVMEPVEAS